MYDPPRVSGKTKFLLGVLGVVFFGLVLGSENLIRVASVLILLAMVIGIGFWLGFEDGEYKGETTQRKRMLDEGYSLGNHDTPETDYGVKALRTCRWCGHIRDEEDK